MNEKELFDHALKNTRLLKIPKRNISTFGTTNIDYYLLTKLETGTRVREGKVISQRPEIIKPSQVAELFEGFGEYGEKYSGDIFEIFGKNPKILNYKFRNSPKTSNDSKLPIHEVLRKINRELRKKDNDMAAIIKGEDATWQISVMKFIVDMTLKSAEGNISDLEEKGLFPDEQGIPEYIRNRIEFLFKDSRKNKGSINKLGKLLNDYGLFREYEDRFFRLFR
ncbi:MAG: hypothetical protein JXJ19_01185 [Elusimicrobia bacterium]|nr:hypothetical protein [Elusimicrobiota bacterium]